MAPVTLTFRGIWGQAVEEMRKNTRCYCHRGLLQKQFFSGPARQGVGLILLRGGEGVKGRDDTALQRDHGKVIKGVPVHCIGLMNPPIRLGTGTSSVADPDPVGSVHF
jgi:hypothetical protein